MSGTRLVLTLVTLAALCSVSWAADGNQVVTPQSAMPSVRSANGFMPSVSATATSAPILQNAFEWEVIGTPSLFAPSDFVVVGEYVYCATAYGLQVVDIFDLDNPKLVASLYTPEAAGIAIQGSTAYLACGSLGLVIIDIANPMAPVQIGSLGLPTTVRELIVAGDYVYAAGYGISFCVVDVSDPASPTEVGRYTSNPEITYVTDMELIGGNVFLTDHNGGFEVIDVSTPASPRKIGGYSTGHSLDMEVSGGLAYVVAGNYGPAGLKVIDISNPARLQQVASISGYFENVTLINGFLYAASQTDDSLRVYSIANPASPVEVAVWPSTGYMARTFRIADTVGLCSYNGLRMINLSNPSHPALMNICPNVAQGCLEVLRDGRYAYTLSEEKGLTILDLGDLTAPKKVGEYAGTAFNAMAKAGDFIFLLSHSGMEIVDVSNPASPQAAGSRADNYNFTSGAIRIEGQRAYVGSEHRIQAFDISNPSQPNLLGEYVGESWGYWIQGMAVRNDTVFLAVAFSGVMIVSFASPADPVLVGNYPSDGRFYAGDVNVSGNYAYAACFNYGLRVIDISSPSLPALVSEMEFFNPADIQVKGSLVFLDGASGLEIIDVSKAESPHLIGMLPLRNDSRSFDITGDTAVVVTSDGMLIARYSSCCEGMTGNVDGFGITDLADLSYLVSYLTGGGVTLTCATETNVDGRGIVDLGDLSAMVSYLTGGGFVLPSCP